MIYGYCRVSTDAQETQRQIMDIEQYAKEKGLTINGWWQETISSRKEERKLYGWITTLEPGDVVIATEFSRLSRGGIIEMSDIIGKLRAVKTSLHIVGKSLVIPGTGKLDTYTSTMIFAFSLAAEIERDMISERTKSAMAAKKAQGYPNGKAGRPEGYRKLADKKDEILGLVMMGLPKIKIAEKYGVSRVTLDKFLKEAKG